MPNTAKPPAFPASAVALYTADQQLFEEHRELLKAATSDETRRTYRAAVRHYLNWGGLLPASEDEVVGYLMAYREALNPSTLTLRLSALSQWHRQQSFPNPVASEIVRKTMKAIVRTYGRPRRKAKPLLTDQLMPLVTEIESLGTLISVRDSAALQIGFFGGMRRGDLVRMRVEDISWSSDGIEILLPKSKTDQDGKGIVKAIPYGPSGGLCPPTALRNWLDAARITTGPVFRAVSRWGQVGEGMMRPAAVNDILARAGGLGLDLTGMSSHSLRRGMATSAYRARATFRAIKRQGGWRSDITVQGYIDDAGAFEENAAGVLMQAQKQAT